MARYYRWVVLVEVGVEGVDESKNIFSLNNREVRKNGGRHGICSETK
jgi:hypothetical protein